MRAVLTTTKACNAPNLNNGLMQCRAWLFVYIVCVCWVFFYDNISRQHCNSRVCHSLAFLFSILISLFHLLYVQLAANFLCLFLYVISSVLTQSMPLAIFCSSFSIFLCLRCHLFPTLVAIIWLTRHLSPLLLPVRLKGLDRELVFFCFCFFNWRHSCCYPHNTTSINSIENNIRNYFIAVNSIKLHPHYFTLSLMLECIWAIIC